MSWTTPGRQDKKLSQKPHLEATTKVGSEATPGGDDNNDENFNKEQPLDAVKYDGSTTMVEERRATNLPTPKCKRVASSLTTNQ